MLTSITGLEQVAARGDENNLHQMLREMYGHLPEAFDTKHLVVLLEDYRKKHTQKEKAPGRRGIPFTGSKIDRISFDLLKYSIEAERYCPMPKKRRYIDERVLKRIEKTTQKENTLFWVFDCSDSLSVRAERWCPKGHGKYLAHEYIVKGKRVTMKSYNGTTSMHDFETNFDATQWAEEFIIGHVF